MCYVKAGSYIRMRTEFEGDGRYRYNGIKMTMINYRKAEVDSSSGVNYGVYAKALLRLLEIRITHSTHVETVILLEKKGQ